MKEYKITLNSQECQDIDLALYAAIEKTRDILMVKTRARGKIYASELDSLSEKIGRLSAVRDRIRNIKDEQ